MSRTSHAPRPTSRGQFILNHSDRHRGFHLTFENGWTISVQWGAGMYSDNHDAWASGEIREASEVAEVAIVDPAGSILDDVHAYCSPEQVLALMADASAQGPAQRATRGEEGCP
jgi:hypothetical protein